MKLADTSVVYALDSNGKRHYPKQSRRAKHFGRLRPCRRMNLFHGFELQPGMWYGEDEDGFFATYGDTHNGHYAVYRSLTTVDVPKTRHDWVHLLEPKTSDLSMKLDFLSEDERNEMIEIRERDHKIKNEIRKQDQDAKRKGKIGPTIQKKLSEFKPARSLGMRKTAAYGYNPRGRKPTVTERNMLDIDPTYQPRRCVTYLP